MTSVSRRCSQQDENEEIIPVFRVVQGQLPHTLDLTWFEPLEGEQDKNIFGPSDPSRAICAAWFKSQPRFFLSRKKLHSIFFKAGNWKSRCNTNSKSFPITRLVRTRLYSASTSRRASRWWKLYEERRPELSSNVLRALPAGLHHTRTRRARELPASGLVSTKLATLTSTEMTPSKRSGFYL